MAEHKAPSRRTITSSKPARVEKPKPTQPKKAAPGRARAPKPARTASEWTIERISTHIRDHAYHLWESEGRPHGKDLELWLRAEKEILTKILP
jgi:hypothetical protein